MPSLSASETPVDFLTPYDRLDETARGDYAGCPHLLKALMRSRPLVHCFGHIHEAWGSERVRWFNTADECTADVVQQVPEDSMDGETVSSFRSIHSNLLKCMSPLAQKEHAASLDLSLDTRKPVKRGHETVLVNASIMDLKYNPKQAPWLIEIDLPMAE